MTKKEKTRQDFKPVNGPRTHGNCKAQYNCFRPGKTALEKWRRGNRDE